MAEIRIEVSIAVPPEKVYAALTEIEKLKEWWTPQCSGDAGTVDESIRFEFPKHNNYCVFSVDNLEMGLLVAWTCTETNMGNSEDWLNTIIKWELNEKDGGSEISFSHSGFPSESETFQHSVKGWNFFILESLKQYLETGKGNPEE